jgi:hypothetical protein
MQEEAAERIAGLVLAGEQRTRLRRHRGILCP